MKRSLLYPQLAGILLLLLLVLPVNATEQLAHHKIRVEIPEILKMEMGSGRSLDLARSKPEGLTRINLSRLLYADFNRPVHTSAGLLQRKERMASPQVG